jgi:hypothetical protein
LQTTAGIAGVHTVRLHELGRGRRLSLHRGPHRVILWDHRGVDAVKVAMRLELTPSLDQLLDDLGGALGLTRPQVIARALGLLDLAVRAEREGERVALVTADGEITRRVDIR